MFRTPLVTPTPLSFQISFLIRTKWSICCCQQLNWDKYMLNPIDILTKQINNLTFNIHYLPHVKLRQNKEYETLALYNDLFYAKYSLDNHFCSFLIFFGLKLVMRTWLNWCPELDRIKRFRTQEAEPTPTHTSFSHQDKYFTFHAPFDISSSTWSSRTLFYA